MSFTSGHGVGALKVTLPRGPLLTRKAAGLSCLVPSGRVAVALSLKEAGAQREGGLLFHLRSLVPPWWHPTCEGCETTLSLVRGSGTVCSPELRQAKEGLLPSGSAELSLLPAPPPRRHMGRCPVWVRTLRQGAQSQWTGGLGTQDLFQQGWREKTGPLGAGTALTVRELRVSSSSRVEKLSLRRV